MSQLSNDFHAFLDRVKSTFSGLFDETKTVVEADAKIALAALEKILADAAPVVLQAGAAAVTAALTASPGGAIGSLVAAAEAAALNTLVQTGKPVLQSDLLALKAQVLASLAKLLPASAVVTAPAPAALAAS